MKKYVIATTLSIVIAGAWVLVPAKTAPDLSANWITNDSGTLDTATGLTEVESPTVTQAPTPVADNTPSQAPVVTPTEPTPAPTVTPPIQVVVLSATQRIVINGDQREYYWDLVYSDNTTSSIMYGKLPYNPSNPVYLTNNCPTYVGKTR